MFANKLMHIFQQQAIVIVYETQEWKRRYLLPPTGPISTGDYGAFSNELDNAKTLYICDCGKDEYLNPARCAALTIVLSSPNTKHYNGWLTAQRNILTLFLPLWSRDEVYAAVPAVYPHRLTKKRDSNGELVQDDVGGTEQVDLHEQRFEIYGGSARFVFSPVDDDNDALGLKALYTRIESCDLALMISTATSSVSTAVTPIEDITWRLLRIDVKEMDADGKPSYRHSKLDFASDHILGKLVAREERDKQQQLVQLLQDTSGSSDASSLRGRVFERYAINVLSAGGDFRARWLNDQTHTEMWLRFPSTRQKGIVDTLENLHTMVSVAHPSSGTSGRFIVLTAVTCCSRPYVFFFRVCKQELARLLKGNVPTIDGAILLQRVHLLQMTISKTHTVNLPGLHNAMQQLNVVNAPSFALFYFVVPPDVYPIFADPTPVGPAVATFPTNVHMIVLELPLPAAGHKRKVSQWTTFTQ